MFQYEYDYEESLKKLHLKEFRQEKLIEHAHEVCPPGTRVRLILMTDNGAPPPGTEGTVTSIDSIGSVHVSWDSGSSLALLFGEDRWEVIP